MLNCADDVESQSLLRVDTRRFDIWQTVRNAACVIMILVAIVILFAICMLVAMSLVHTICSAPLDKFTAWQWALSAVIAVFILGTTGVCLYVGRREHN